MHIVTKHEVASETKSASTSWKDGAFPWLLKAGSETTAAGAAKIHWLLLCFGLYYCFGFWRLAVYLSSGSKLSRI